MARSNPANQTSFSSPRGGKPRRDQARVHPLCRGRAVAERAHCPRCPLPSPATPCATCHRGALGPAGPIALNVVLGGHVLPRAVPAPPPAAQAGGTLPIQSPPLGYLRRKKKKKKELGFIPFLQIHPHFSGAPGNRSVIPLRGSFGSVLHHRLHHRWYFYLLRLSRMIYPL